jgi:galactokinase
MMGSGEQPSLPPPTHPTHHAISPAQRTTLRRIAPARVNLLGEHTDYTGGLVLPMAIPFVTEATISPRDDNRYSFTSELFPDTLAIDSDDHSSARGLWADYPVGVLQQLQQLGIHPPAFNLHLTGNVPFGAGVSSSASVEVASAMAMLAFAGVELTLEDIAVLARRAENEYVNPPAASWISSSSPQPKPATLSCSTPALSPTNISP